MFRNSMRGAAQERCGAGKHHCRMPNAGPQPEREQSFVINLPLIVRMVVFLEEGLRGGWHHAHNARSSHLQPVLGRCLPPHTNAASSLEGALG